MKAFLPQKQMETEAKGKQFGRRDGKPSSRRGGPEIKALGRRKASVQASGSTHLKYKVTVNEEKRNRKVSSN